MKVTQSIPDRQEGVHRFSHPAMATLFEVMIADEDPEFAEQSAMAAFAEIDRLEQELSRFLPNSDIARMTNLQPGIKLRVGWDAFECLRLSKIYSRDTSGAFDITVGSSRDSFAGGVNLIDLDEATLTISLKEVVPKIDLGAIGKGYAVDRASDLLLEWGVENAMVHGGGSSVFAFGNCPRAKGWPVTISSPDHSGEVKEIISLRKKSLSGSGIGRRQHIIDPRTGSLVTQRLAAWVCSESAAESDAISTACMILDETEIQRYSRLHPGTWAMICEIDHSGGEYRYARFGGVPPGDPMPV